MKESITLLDVFTISEYQAGEPSDKDRWLRIGIGFINRDDSINVVLDALPVNGRLHLRKRVPASKMKKEAA